MVRMNGATLIRTESGITASLSMPTRAPADYCNPPPNPFQTVAPVPGIPEVFTGWFFFFNYPENCAVPNQCLPPPPGMHVNVLPGTEGERRVPANQPLRHAHGKERWLAQ